MGELMPFELEDFFYEYEHRAGLINLASSDSEPWALREIQSSSAQVSALMEGLDIATVAKMAGTSIRMIERVYGHFRSSHFEAAQRKLDEGRQRRRVTT